MQSTNKPLKCHAQLICNLNQECEQIISRSATSLRMLMRELKKSQRGKNLLNNKLFSV
jgi:hypothetical protein